jgi:tetratricopeptide (TPR) repeat protein
MRRALISLRSGLIVLPMGLLVAAGCSVPERSQVVFEPGGPMYPQQARTCLETQRRGADDQAIACYSEVLAYAKLGLHMDNRGAALLYTSRAISYSRLGLDAEAIRDLEAAVGLDPNNTQAAEALLRLRAR